MTHPRGNTPARGSARGPARVRGAAHSTTTGLIIAVVAAFTFGTSGALVKPLLESGWSPAAAVTARALLGGALLLPAALFLVRGRWRAVWRGRWRILGMAVIGAGGTQLLYIAAIQRIPVNTAILIEYMAPLLLVGFVWARTRRIPRPVVLIGSAVAVAGLVLVVSPGSAGSFDALGLTFAAIAAVGCAIYYVIAAAPSVGLPPIALASFGLLGGGVFVGAAGLLGLVPFVANLDGIPVLGATLPWWLLLLLVGAISTAIPYATSITATEILGSRLSSFVGLLEVVAAALYAWLLLGEALTVPQLLGGVLILAGIAFVRSDRTADLNPALEPGTEPGPGPATEPSTGPATVPGTGSGTGSGTDSEHPPVAPTRQPG